MVVTLADLVPLPVSMNAMEWAVTTSTQKVLHTDYGFIRRYLPQRLQNTFQGDLAKSCFKEWLINNGVHEENMWEYDENREHFRSYNRLGYHLRITNDEQEEYRIDVNSSMTRGNESDEYIINNYDIKVKAGNYSKNLIMPDNLRSDIYVQIYVRPKFGMLPIEADDARDRLQNESTEATMRILNIGDAYFSDDVFFGFAWATKEDVEEFRMTNLARNTNPTWRGWPGFRIYWKCPIQESSNFLSILPYLT